VSIIPFLIVVFTTKTMSAILWCLVFFGSPFLFIALANKYVLLKTSHQVIADNSDDLIIPMLEKILQRFKEKQPVVLRNLEEYYLQKMKLIQEIRENPTEKKWLKKVLIFALKKVRLDDIDFSDEHLDFFKIMKIKTIQFLQSVSKPKRTMIWLPIIIQWVILVIIAAANY
jgi:hypothetical protein